MREHLSYLCKSISDKEHRELKVADVLNIFKEHYFFHQEPISVSEMHFHRRKRTDVEAEIVFVKDGQSTTIRATGNGSLDAVSNALKAFTGDNYELLVYTEHSMQEQGSGSVAAAYIGIKDGNGNMNWGAGTDTDIIHASANALISAFNNMKNKN
jgi:2-isopropylmalate synthase